MELFLLALATLFAGTLFSALLFRRDAAAHQVATICGAAGSALGLLASLRALGRPAAGWRASWTMPAGELHLGVDGLSLLFLCCIFALGLGACIFSRSYLAAFAGHKSLAAAGSMLNVLIASTALVALARDGMLFLVAWELMALSSYLLVVFEHQRPEVRSAGLLYLVMSHAGTACLMAFFVLLAREHGSFDLNVAGAIRPGLSAPLLLLALAGFGLKAGLVPLQAWLPEAHPAAPTHVSAVMSGAVIKCGIYGIARAVLLAGEPRAWFGWTLVGAGALSAVLGASNALAQRDVKRSLAWSSIDNIGIISIGLGIGVVGAAERIPLLAALGFAAAGLHVVAHAAFKWLLFSAAGAAAHGAGTRDLDLLGGLAHRMPGTAALFLVGAAAASALPGFSGFVSEWFTLRALFAGLQQLGPAGQAAAAAGVAALALTGGLAAAGFARSWGTAFAGSPRSEGAAHAHEAAPSMLFPMALLAGLCVLFGILPSLQLALVLPAVAQLAGSTEALVAPLQEAVVVGRIGAALFAVAGVIALLRGGLLARREVRAACTWGCGYAQPSPRMQYTATAFARPLTQVFEGVLAIRETGTPPQSYFPIAVIRNAEADDPIERALYRPLLAWGSERLFALRRRHGARLQQYLLYIFFAIIALLIYASRLLRP